MMMHVLMLAQNNGADGGNPLATALMAAGVAMLVVVLMINAKKLRRRQRGALTPHEKVERIKQSHGMKNDLREMMVELEDLTRRFSAQLDAKAVRLERLIDEADQRIAQLKAGERLDEQKPSSNGEPPASGSQQGGAPGAVGDGEGGGRVEPDEPLDPLTRDVYGLADEGHEPVAIAKRLNEHVGKVELILALREQ